ncbi:IPT/TIG domain-containing protein [Actinoplanes sp. NPDC049265]|uniref:IPT/TIG domain-containing protein n=1 Tax=Actinoplanes sp. NPDC049265 TaxID=3363902 RepID=UPI00371C7843
MRRAIRDRAGILAILVLAVFGFAAPARADSPGDEPSFDAMADGAPLAAEAVISEDESHMGGYVAPPTRLNARPGSLGAGAYDQLPASVDLRSYAPAVGDQGSIGACVAWTLSRSIMGYYANRTGTNDAPYAPLYLYMRNVAAGGAPSSGTNPDSVLANLQAYGVDAQDDYFQGTTNYKVAPTAAQISTATNYKITGYTRLFSGPNQGVNAKTVIMQALAGNTPVAVGFPVYRDFMDLGQHTVYNTLSGTSLGGHMVTAFGYDSEGVILRNQWGTGWGNNGDAKVSWAFVQQVMTAAYTVSGISGPDTSITPAPQVTQLSVAKGSAGASVTIIGSGLAKATKVTFGGTSASFTRTVTNGVTRLVATAPAHAGGSVQVAVTNPAGTSPDTGADDFAYPMPAPVINGLNPNAGTTQGGTRVTLTGTDLESATSVTIGTDTVTPSDVTDGSLTFVTPSHTAGNLNVTVTNAAGKTSAAARFAYVTPAAPIVTGIAPATGRANTTTQITITGSNLDNATAVTVDGDSVPFAKVSSTQIRVNLPARAAGSADIRVITPTGNSGTTFTYVAPSVPTITGLSPNSGLTNATTTVVVTGTNLGNVSKVLLSGTVCSYTMVNATTLKVFVKPRAAGSSSLTITTGGGTSAPATWTSVTPGKPVIGALSPAQGLAASTTTVTVTGTGFTGTTRISIGGRATTFTRVSSTKLTFVAPALGRAASVPVVVTSPGGVSMGKTFSYKTSIAPTLTAISPATGPTTSNTAAVLTGRYLTGASIVTAAGKRVSFKRVSDTQINITLVRRSAGTVDIQVRTSGGLSNTLTFRYVAPSASASTVSSAAAVTRTSRPLYT